MPAQYLLPCSCGQKVLVDARTAGETARCSCGATVDVPALRELAKLERAADVAPVVRSTWNPAKGLAFLGVVVALAGLLGAAGMKYYQKQVIQTLPGFDVDLIDNQKEVEKMGLGVTYELWKELQRGFMVPETPTLRVAREKIERLQQGIYFSLIIAAIGAVGAIGGMIYAGSSATKQAGPRTAKPARAR